METVYNIQLLIILIILIIPRFSCQDSEDDWVEAQPQTQAAKAWQVPDESKPPENNIGTAQNVQVTTYLLIAPSCISDKLQIFKCFERIYLAFVFVLNVREGISVWC